MPVRDVTPAAPGPDVRFYDPWNHTGGPRPRIPGEWLSPAARSRHHGLTGPTPWNNAQWLNDAGLRDVDRLLVIPYALFDTMEVGPKGHRMLTAADWTAGGFLWRPFVDPCGKTNAEISPVIATGGQLSMPRCFDARRVQVLFLPQPTWLEREEAIDGYGTRTGRFSYVEKRADAVDLAKARADIAAMKQFQFCLQVGIRDYVNGTLADLPWHCNVFIPPRQAFYGDLQQLGHSIPQFTYVWQIRVRLEGFLGMEVM
jgi:hypothetical protein